MALVGPLVSKSCSLISYSLISWNLWFSCHHTFIIFHPFVMKTITMILKSNHQFLTTTNARPKIYCPNEFLRFFFFCRLKRFMWSYLISRPVCITTFTITETYNGGGYHRPRNNKKVMLIFARKLAGRVQSNSKMLKNKITKERTSQKWSEKNQNVETVFLLQPATKL